MSTEAELPLARERSSRTPLIVPRLSSSGQMMDRAISSGEDDW